MRILDLRNIDHFLRVCIINQQTILFNLKHELNPQQNTNVRSVLEAKQFTISDKIIWQAVLIHQPNLPLHVFSFIVFTYLLNKNKDAHHFFM